jgi:DNA polymerase-1
MSYYKPDFTAPTPVVASVRNSIGYWRHPQGPWARPQLQGPAPDFGGWSALDDMAIINLAAKPAGPDEADDGGAGALLAQFGVGIDYIRGGERFAAFAAMLDGVTTPLAFDTETAPLLKHAGREKAGLSPWLARWRLLQFWWHGAPNAVIVDVPAVLADLGPARFREACAKLIGGARPIIAHNAKFELAFAWTMGIDIPWAHDTALLYACAYNASGQGLANVVRKRLKITLDKDLQVSDWARPQLSNAQLAYAALDPVITLKAFDALQGDVQRMGLENGLALAQDAIRPTARADLMGVPYDIDAAMARMTQLEAQHEDAKHALHAALGLQPGATVKLTPATVGARLQSVIPAGTLDKWEKTKTGQLKLPKGYLPLLDFDPKVKAFAKAYLAYTSTASLLTYARKRLAQVNPVTGRFHISWRLLGARTGRFGSSPNLQNWNKRDRTTIKPRPGRKIIRADFSQEELRVYASAQVGDDIDIRSVYARQGDIHIATASRTAGLTEEQFSTLGKQEAKQMRQRAKACNFGLLFGLAAPSFTKYVKVNYGVDMERDEAEDLIESFFGAWPAMRIWQQRQTNFAEHALASWTVGGRRRNMQAELEDILEKAESKFNRAIIDLDDTELDFDEREDLEIILAATRPAQVKAIFFRKAGRAGMNCAVQGSAADVLLRALWRLDVALAGLDACVICHVHDEIVVEASDEHAEQAAAILEREAKAAYREMFPTTSDEEMIGLIDAEIVDAWAIPKDFE